MKKKKGMCAQSQVERLIEHQNEIHYLTKGKTFYR